MNSYFATAEQQANPYLRGRPVGIVKAAGRGCVIAASIEAKKFGVKTGCTVWEARSLCPRIILVPSDMDKYFAITKGLIAIANRYSPAVEIFSIDEMFLDITDVQSLYSGGVLEIALSIKKDIKQELGEWLKASIGVSHTKLLAKLGSELNKPDGLTFLTSENCFEMTDDVNVEEVCGIGYARTALLHRKRIYTLGQARQAELPREIADLVWFRVDEPLTRIVDLEPAKSVSRTFTTFRQFDRVLDIRRLTRNLVEEATSKLREMNMVGRTFCLSLDSFWARRTVQRPLDHGKLIFDLVWKEYLKNPILGIRHAGVSITNLMSNNQYSVFKVETNALKAMDNMNEKYGLFTVYPGSLLGGELIRPEVTGYLGDKWYRFGH